MTGPLGSPVPIILATVNLERASSEQLISAELGVKWLRAMLSSRKLPCRARVSTPRELIMLGSNSSPPRGRSSTLGL